MDPLFLVQEVVEIFVTFLHDVFYLLLAIALYVYLEDDAQMKAAFVQAFRVELFYETSHPCSIFLIHLDQVYLRIAESSRHLEKQRISNIIYCYFFLYTFT